MTRGEIWWADFGIPRGSESGFRRPVLIVQDDAFNKSNIATIVVVPFSTNLLLAEAPGNVFVGTEATRLPRESVVVTSQIHAVDRTRLIERVWKIGGELLEEVEGGLMTVLGLRRFG